MAITLEQRVMSTHPAGSWCVKEKAMRMAEIIEQDKPAIAVEIGVFGGDSLFVMAHAMQHIGAGKAYGIDAWDKEAALVGLDAKNSSWWDGIDLEAYYRSTRTKLKAYGLEPWCELIRSKSTDPATLDKFPDGSIGFFHFDGNHTHGLADVTAWLSKITVGGTIFYDDVNWAENNTTTNFSGYEYLLDHGCEMREGPNGVLEMIGDCAVMRKTK